MQSTYQPKRGNICTASTRVWRRRDLVPSLQHSDCDIAGGAPRPPRQPAVQSLRRARGRLPLRGLHLRGLQVLLRADVQQPVRDRGVQEQLQVRGGQEEQDLVQGLQTPQVSDGRHVQVRLQVREEVQLVQDPLPHA